MLAQKDRGPSTRAALAQDDSKSQNRSRTRFAQDDPRGPDNMGLINNEPGGGGTSRDIGAEA